jgi:hypothetical protein
MLHPGLYYEGTGITDFVLFANDPEHLARIWQEIRNTLDESGCVYTAARSMYSFRIIDMVIHQPIVTLSCSHLMREDIVAAMLIGRRLTDIFLCASEETIARKVNDDFMSRAVPALYDIGLDGSSFVNKLTQGEFNMSTHLDTVHTNRQRLYKIRSVLHAADKICNSDSYDAISKQAAIDALREASKEALSSLNAIEQCISDSGEMDKT